MTGWLESIARGPHRPIAIALAAVLLTGILAWLVAERVAILQSPNEVVLRTEPVDPRDFFRGDYVRLTYDISALSAPALNMPADEAEALQDNTPIFVAVKESPGGTWEATAMATDRSALPADAVVLKGKVRWVRSRPLVRQPTPDGPTFVPEEEACPKCPIVNVRYGIETYFVPEGEGRELEKQRDQSTLRVHVAVAENGNAAIKALSLNDGETICVEPLF